MSCPVRQERWFLRRSGNPPRQKGLCRVRARTGIGEKVAPSGGLACTWHKYLHISCQRPCEPQKFENVSLSPLAKPVISVLNVISNVRQEKPVLFCVERERASFWKYADQSVFESVISVEACACVRPR